MQAPSLVQQVVAEVAPVLATLLASVLTTVLIFLANELKKRVTNASGLDALNKLAHLSETAVLALEQTLKAELEKRALDGELSAHELREVKDQAVAMVKVALSQKGIDSTMKALGYNGEKELDLLISQHIEAAVARAKAYLGRKLTASIETTDPTKDLKVTAEGG